MRSIEITSARRAQRFTCFPLCRPSPTVARPTIPRDVPARWRVGAAGRAEIERGQLIASRAGSFSKCKVVTKASDGATPLTFTIKQNGIAIFSSAPTIAATTSPGTISTFTGLTSNPLPFAADDLFTIDVTSGTSSWQATIQLEP
jgi:hypothetical protein